MGRSRHGDRGPLRRDVGRADGRHPAAPSGLRAAAASGAHAVVTLDGASGYQPGGQLRVPQNISLLTLPPHSPELNPLEDVCQFQRQNYLSNRI